MTKNETTGNRLQKLKGSDFEVANGQPDIRGWDLRSDDGKHMGKVTELIFDVQARKVRYMIANLDKAYVKRKAEHVLIPVGVAKLQEVDEDVSLPGVTVQQLAALPTYDGVINADMENSIRSVLAGVGVATAATALQNSSSETSQDNFYDHAHFNEDALSKNQKGFSAGQIIPIIEENVQVEKKTVDTGGAYIQSRIVEKPVEEKVTLQEENVYVERNAAGRPATATDFDAFKEGVIELKEHAEVPVISKQARVVEEVVIEKDVEEHVEKIRETARRTEVEVEKIEQNTTTSTGLSNNT